MSENKLEMFEDGLEYLKADNGTSAQIDRHRQRISDEQENQRHDDYERHCLERDGKA